MANPRKFSEKIALHNQKQEEETRAFQQIMKEVMDATVRPPGAPTTPTATTPQPISPSAQNQQQQQNHNHLSISLSNYRGHGGSLPNVNQISQHEKGSHSSRGLHQNSMSPRSPRNSIGPVRSKHRNDHSPYASPPSATMLSSSMTSATSGGFSSYGLGYGNGPAYLSPPENQCRRAISESALHNLLIPSTVPDSSEESSNNSNDPRDYNVSGLSRSPLHDSFSNNGGMRSHTGGDGSARLELPQASMSMSSTGSLPDLTTFHFPPPLQQPLDIDEHSQQNHSPYSTSPLTGSSMTYSPTSLSPHCSPQGAGSGGGQAQQQQSQAQGSPAPHSPQSQQQQNPLHVNTSFQNFSNDNMLSAYRNPQRPSPQNSPSPFRSASPVDGNLSAPASPSPGQTNPTNNDFYANQQAQVLQQHFEQISMGDRLQNGHQNHMRMNRQWNEGANAGGQYFYNQAGQIPNTGATAGVTTQQSPQHPQPQTPQTPSSIPDIIFTDFSDVRGTEPLDDLLANEQLQAAFRDGISPLDFQILDQDFVQLDNQVDESFRLDRQVDDSFRLDRL